MSLFTDFGGSRSYFDIQMDKLARIEEPAWYDRGVMAGRHNVSKYPSSSSRSRPIRAKARKTTKTEKNRKVRDRKAKALKVAEKVLFVAGCAFLALGTLTAFGGLIALVSGVGVVPGAITAGAGAGMAVVGFLLLVASDKASRKASEVYQRGH